MAAISSRLPVAESIDHAYEVALILSSNLSSLQENPEEYRAEHIQEAHEWIQSFAGSFQEWRQGVKGEVELSIILQGTADKVAEIQKKIIQIAPPYIIDKIHQLRFALAENQDIHSIRSWMIELGRHAPVFKDYLYGSLQNLYPEQSSVEFGKAAFLGIHGVEVPSSKKMEALDLALLLQIIDCLKHGNEEQAALYIESLPPHVQGILFANVYIMARVRSRDEEALRFGFMNAQTPESYTFIPLIVKIKIVEATYREVLGNYRIDTQEPSIAIKREGFVIPPSVTQVVMTSFKKAAKKNRQIEFARISSNPYAMFAHSYDARSTFGKLIHYKDLKFFCAEAAILSQQFADPLIQRKFQRLDSRQAKQLSGSYSHLARKDWLSVKNRIEYQVLECKFGQNAALKTLLLATDNAALIDRDSSKNRFERNLLGKMLTQLRSSLRTSELAVVDAKCPRTEFGRTRGQRSVKNEECKEK